ncbi:winged helix-turn-helix domain-containing protein [Amycolatopsis suaedae]|uniref:ArsR family transcriptional regulator n=1 Tax=Amycolatopsis suaedae TaxID=2510978 RepID=A0A4Q7IZF5_9PSEU|nr:winged helix-turn-helix domain-containing protein [Amycolatopsis suaedae]RZQ59662.1 ArsR family transcriptional regulator [Amycolatopsis suaedae]
MTLRIVFERDDLQRVRLAEAADPMWEVVLSLHRLRDRAAGAHGPWRHRARRALRNHAESVATLFTLVPQRGGFPDFLTPARTVAEVGAGCEALACARRTQLRADLAATFAHRAVPRWVRGLADGDGGELRRVVSAVRTVYDAVVTPHEQTFRAAVAADRAARTRTLATGGVGALLASLPAVRGWDGETLTVDYPAPRTLRLAGRGLTLVPSHFCAGSPVTLVDPELPPVLVYPASAFRAPVSAPVPAGLVTLLGRTRAESLSALAVARTTSALAGHLGTSVGTASRQAAVLRDAGLITSTRRGGAVVHQVTRLGAALLGGTHPADGS